MEGVLGGGEGLGEALDFAGLGFGGGGELFYGLFLLYELRLELTELLDLIIREIIELLLLEQHELFPFELVFLLQVDLFLQGGDFQLHLGDQRF